MPKVVTFRGASSRDDRTGAIEVDVDGKTHRFEQDRPVPDVPEKVVKRLGESDLSGFKFDIDSTSKEG